MRIKKAADQVLKNFKVASNSDRDSEWQRVNSYVADVLKDSHVLYAKLARLQSDFVGEELDRLMKISESVLSIGTELSAFSKAFYEGKLTMADNEFSYGNVTPEESENFVPFGGAEPGSTPPALENDDSEDDDSDESDEEDESEEDDDDSDDDSDDEEDDDD